ncbi:hypothetical protein D3C77_450660 [compost metagenome]
MILAVLIREIGAVYNRFLVQLDSVAIYIESDIVWIQAEHSPADIVAAIRFYRHRSPV